MAPFLVAMYSVAPATGLNLINTDIHPTGFTGVSTSAAPAPCTGTTEGTTDNDLINGVCKDLTLIFARGTFEGGNFSGVVGPPLANANVSMLGGAQVAVQGVNSYPADVVDFFAG